MRLLFLTAFLLFFSVYPAFAYVENLESIKHNSIIIEVDGNPYEHGDYIQLHHPFIEIIAIYDTLMNGLALKGKSKQLKEVASLDFVKSIHTVQTYKPAVIHQFEKLLDQESDYFLPSELNDTEYTGKGVKVGVIDTGIDYNHPDIKENYVGGYDLVDLDDDPMETDPNEGIPTTHGTHVAGIIAANGYLQGVAPDASIYAYRALGPGGMGTSIQVIAALERAVKDGMDIINLSLGNSVNGPDYPTSLAVNKAVDMGAALVIANGNEGPDYWTVGSPATAEKSVSVGAWSHPKQIPVLYEKKHNKEISLLPMSGPFTWKLQKDYPVINFDKQENVNGKIALILRSETPLYESVKNAANNGAVAVLIVNDDEGEFHEAITNEEEPIQIPVASISQDDGEWIVQALEQKEIYLDTIYKEEIEGTASFSSRGPVTVNWQIKPDILAPGTNVLSTIPNGYAILNGTSMAAPHVAGAIAVIKEAKREWTNEQIISALKTTAQQIKKEDGDLTDPIEQGMGKIQIQKAIDTDTIIHNSLLAFGQMDNYKESKKVKLTIENVSDKDQTYQFRIPKYKKGIQWNLPQTFTVKKGEQKEIFIELETIPTLNKEGIYQGWLQLEKKDKGQTYYLPYLFVNENANQPIAEGFHITLKPFAKDMYTYQLYMTERAEQIKIHIYDYASLLYERTLLSLQNVNIGLKEGEIEILDMDPGTYKAVVDIQLENGEYESFETDLIIPEQIE